MPHPDAELTDICRELGEIAHELADSDTTTHHRLLARRIARCQARLAVLDRGTPVERLLRADIAAISQGLAIAFH